MITENHIQLAQKQWADALIEIGSMRNSPREEIEKRTLEIIKTLYSYQHSKVLFKPTKACTIQFRNTIDAALSYFIGGNKQFPEDKGFALQPWKKVAFENEDMILAENRATVVGNYYFTDFDDNEIKVEYTFSYVRFGEQIKIELHHSSIPFKCNKEVEIID
jgi:hypothetical protein